jgi:hypothetical protein
VLELVPLPEFRYRGLLFFRGAAENWKFYTSCCRISVAAADPDGYIWAWLFCVGLQTCASTIGPSQHKTRTTNA